MKIINIVLLFVIGLTFFECTKDAFESELDNPTLTAVTVSLNKTIDTNGNISSDIWVSTADKNGNFVAIQDGWVKVDGMKMKLKENVVNNKKAYYYSAEDIYHTVEVNKLYNFQIKLSDGNIYAASITTQDKDLHELSIPAYQPIHTEMQVSWKEVDPETPMRLTLITTYENNGTIFTQWNLGSLAAQRGTFTFSKELFVDSSTKIKQATVTLSSIKSGTIDNRLSTGSEIMSTFNIEKSCVVK